MTALATGRLWSAGFGHGERARPAPKALALGQIRWIGALLLAAQLPQAPHLPVWIALFGMTLVVMRMWFATRDARRPDAPPTRIPSWALVLFAIVAAWFVRVSFGGHLAGRDPSVAFLFILLGIKFLEARSRRDGTLLVCLAMFMLITPFLADQSAVAALAVLPAMLLLGATLEALARDHTATPAKSALGRSLLLLLQGIPLAAVLFVLFPRLSAPLWGLPQDYAAQSGLSDTMAPGMISELSLSDAVAFRVDFDGPPPPPALRYWRGPVLTRFDGRVWSALSTRGEGRFASGAPDIRYTVTLEPSFKPWLFALELPSGPPELAGNLDDTPPGRTAILTSDQQLITRGAIAQVTRYIQRSELVNHFPATSDLDVRLARIPPPGNPRSKALAREMRERYPDDRAYAAAILTMFHDENFVYTLTPPLLPKDPVDMFLFDERRGFCEHFASAFTVLLRDAGIPARVVTGYQGGEMNPRGGYMIVRQSDAHAWTEAYIDGEWRRYDPTAAVAPNRIERGIGGSLPAGEPVPRFARLDGGWLNNIQLTLDAMNHAWSRNVVGFNQARQRELWQDLHLTAGNAPWVVGGIAAAIGLWGALVLAWMAWQRQSGERAVLLWHRACARLAAAGLPRMPHEGPFDYARRASLCWPQFAIAFSAIAESYAALRYGSAAEGAGSRDALLSTLDRAIDVLPAPAALRNATRPGARSG
jgi:transglutaminase-like putative cysteine protease